VPLAWANAKHSWTERTAADPSPTAAATRLIEPARTSPAANNPGWLVSKGSGKRPSGDLGAVKDRKRNFGIKHWTSLFYARSARTRGITWVPYSSMFLISASCERPPMPYFKTKRVAPSAVRLAAIFCATVSGDPT
jgi:hypothetical protein